MQLDQVLVGEKSLTVAALASERLQTFQGDPGGAEEARLSA